VRKKSGRKYQKAYEWYFLVSQKMHNPIMTKWCEKTMKKVQARLKLFGITKAMVDQYMSKRSSVK